MSFSITGECATAPHARTLLDIFTATALRCGVCTAIDAPDAQLTYRGLDEAAEAMATRLRGLGIGTGDRVAIQVRSGTSELYVAILGVVACLHYPQRGDLQSHHGLVETVATPCPPTGVRAVREPPLAGTACSGCSRSSRPAVQRSCW